MNISVIGTGYVGLVVGACLSDMGNNVVCVDNNKDKLEKLKNGVIPIFEPGLEELVKINVSESRLEFTSDIDYAVKKSKVCFIAVGTPQNEDGTSNLDYVREVVDSIAKSINEYKVIVDKSTVPVGTARKITEYIKKITDIPFDVVSNPEFLKQGNAVDDFLKPDRIIIGTDSKKALEIMQDIYSPFIKDKVEFITMDVKSAEMTKYASNSFLATKISFMNEIANLCEKVGADVDCVRRGMASDNRIGAKFLYSGLGYGGSCFPKDVNSLICTGRKYEIPMNILKEVSSVNFNQRMLFIKKIAKRFDNDLKDKTFAIWGLSFKPNTNDMREAPSKTIIEYLLDNGAKIQAYDPKAMSVAKNIFDDKIQYVNNSYIVLKNVDALLLLTEWNEFRRPDFDKMKSLMKNAIIFDGRNLYELDMLEKIGFEYYCIGRKSSNNSYE